jgi:uncharacterized glyoxalase superfamily protein PhnB
MSRLLAVLLVIHAYFNRRCKEAVGLFVKAFKADIRTVIMESDTGKTASNPLAVHAEVCICGQMRLLM